jgi:hypothetical protein
MVAVAVLVVAFPFIRGRLNGQGPVLKVRDVPRAIAAVRQHGGEPSFLMVMFDPTGTPGEAAINLQLSKERGRLGVDWVLISPANVADRPKVEGFMRSRGHSVSEHQENGVRFLRVENGDLDALAMAILTDIYRLKADAMVETVMSGFEFQP